MKLRCAGLFAGIGGIELGLSRAGIEAEMLCEISPAARDVLSARFPDARIEHDVREIKALPSVDIVAAGFPCQDLSQAGQTKGISGLNSGLVNEMFRLISTAKKKPTWLLFENVPFMLALQKGQAMRHLVTSIEALGYRWAYRVVDARSFGVPQRRRRVILLASRSKRPEDVLLVDDVGDPNLTGNRRTARGFYWTEGRTGLGWAVGAIPTLKGGSSIGIPSPPAIWFPARRTLELPGIRDAERLQGFEAGWTGAAEAQSRLGRNARWKLVGNAVCVPMMEWVGHRLVQPGKYAGRSDGMWDGASAWPNAAWGSNGRVHVSSASSWPSATTLPSLSAFLKHKTKPLSARATRGFLARARSSGLNFEDGFLDDVEHHLSMVEASD
ncbi:DNA cytosine methyltransferase [Variovorax boronicumulans]|uniref:DNA cytosine methyltransferase n=1 Tax=Variovorax boronicumulans TaxID=436515 RepID=UPI003390E34A